VASFAARFHMRPDNNAALAYDATMVVAQAIERAGPDRTAIRDYLGSMQEANAYNGLTGRIAFQQSGDVAGKPMAMTRVRRGALVLQTRGRQ